MSGLAGDKTQPLCIGIDIGGTNLRAAVVDHRGRILDSEQIPTPVSGTALYAGIETVVRLLTARHEIAAVGLAVAGFLNADCTIVRFAPHLPWRDEPVVEALTTRLGLPVRMEHDANSAAWGEHRFGAAQGVSTWAMIALGTGIGGAVMINGQLYRGAFGTAPEFGHLTVVPDGRPCSCGKRGCLERYCSGTALGDTAKELLSCDHASTPFARAVCRGDIVPTGKAVMRAAKEGDGLALAVVADFSRWLGQGFSLIADVFDPELIIVAGGVSRNAELFLHEAREHFKATMTGSGHRPVARTRCAELGGDAGMIGAADLARDML